MDETAFFAALEAAPDAAQQAQIYRDAAAGYDALMEQQLYALPMRIAQAAEEHVADKALEIMDFGCGTGLCGAALRAAGYHNLHGVDMVPEMVAQARAKDLYSSLEVIDPEAALPRSYPVILAGNSVGLGAAPASALARLEQALVPGGLLILTLSDASLASPAYGQALFGLIQNGLRRISDGYGPLYPTLGQRAAVTILQKQDLDQ